MKFRAVRFVNARYTVSPDHWAYHQTVGGGRREKVKGTHVYFVNGMFDSIDGQKREKWSDETREVVENWMLNHEEYGVQFVRDLAEVEVVKPAASIVWCDFIHISENGTQMCGLPVTEGSRCGQHQPEEALVP